MKERQDKFSIESELEGIRSILTMIATPFLEHDSRFSDDVVGTAIASVEQHLLRIEEEISKETDREDTEVVNIA